MHCDPCRDGDFIHCRAPLRVASPPWPPLSSAPALSRCSDCSPTTVTAPRSRPLRRGRGPACGRAACENLQVPGGAIRAATPTRSSYPPTQSRGFRRSSARPKPLGLRAVREGLDAELARLVGSSHLRKGEGEIEVGASDSSGPEVTETWVTVATQDLSGVPLGLHRHDVGRLSWSGRTSTSLRLARTCVRAQARYWASYQPARASSSASPTSVASSGSC